MASINPDVLDTITDLAELERKRWREILDSIEGPVCAEDPDPDPRLEGPVAQARTPRQGSRQAR
jgi:hypothetical protein